MPTSKKKISFNAFWKINEKDFTKGITKEHAKNLKILMRGCYNLVGKKREETIEDMLTFGQPRYPRMITNKLITVLPKGESKLKRDKV